MPSIAVVRGENESRPAVMIEPVGDFQMSYNMVDGLVELLNEKFSVVVKERLDGAGERLWNVEIEEFDIKIFDDNGAGLMIYSKDKNANELLGRMGDFLEQRIPKD